MISGDSPERSLLAALAGTVYTLGVNIVRAIVYFLLFASVASAGDHTNLESTRIVLSPLEDVKVAIDTYCQEAKTKRHTGLFITSKSYTPGSNYSLRLWDCTFDFSTPLQGELIATAQSTTKTQLQLKARSSGLNTNEFARLTKKISTYLQEIDDVLKRKPVPIYAQ